MARHPASCEGAGPDGCATWSPSEELSWLRVQLGTGTEPVVAVALLFHYCRDHHAELWEHAGDRAARVAVTEVLAPLTALLPASATAPTFAPEVRAVLSSCFSGPSARVPPAVLAHGLAEFLDDRYAASFGRWFRRRSPYRPEFGDPVPRRLANRPPRHRRGRAPRAERHPAAGGSAAKLGRRDAPVLWFAMLRALVAGVALLAWGLASRRPQPRGWPAWRLIGALGVTNASLAFGAMFAGVAGAATGVAAVLANAQPLLILLPVWWLYKERVSRRTAVAMVVGFAGPLIVAGPGGGGRGAWLSMIAAAGITVGSLLARRLGALDVVLVLVSGWHFLLGGTVLAVAAAVTEGAPAISWTPRFVTALGFLAIIGTAAAFVAWFEEIQRSALGPLTAWTFLVPVFGIGFGAILLAGPSGLAPGVVVRLVRRNL